MPKTNQASGAADRLGPVFEKEKARKYYSKNSCQGASRVWLSSSKAIAICSKALATVDCKKNGHIKKSRVKRIEKLVRSGTAIA